MKRIAALIAAVAMVAGAWAIRSRIDRGPEPPVRLTCSTELQDVCTELPEEVATVTIEAPGQTAARLVAADEGADPEFDVWLTSGPWPEMVRDQREFDRVPGDVLGDASEVLARSPVVLMVPAEQRAQLESDCGGTVTWPCVLDPNTGIPTGVSGTDRTDGLLSLANAAAGTLGDTRYDSSALEDAAVRSWLGDLRSDGRSLGDRTALETALVQQGRYRAVGALEADALRLAATRDDWSPIYPDPMSVAEVRLVPRTGDGGAEALDRLDRDELVRLLGEQQWRTNGGEPPLPDGTGLPSAGVLNLLWDPR
jgi:hypothetical protein